MEEKTRKRKTSVTLDPDLWLRWVEYCTVRSGSLQTVSKTLEQALMEFMNNNPLPVKVVSRSS